MDEFEKNILNCKSCDPESRISRMIFLRSLTYSRKRFELAKSRFSELRKDNFCRISHQNTSLRLTCNHLLSRCTRVKFG